MCRLLLTFIRVGLFSFLGTLILLIMDLRVDLFWVLSTTSFIFITIFDSCSMILESFKR